MSDEAKRESDQIELRILLLFQRANQVHRVVITVRLSLNLKLKL